MSSAFIERGRTGQKLRTRRDLLAAARTLIDRGTEITLAGVSDEAGISRATTYRYFPDADTLVIEAVLDGLVDLPKATLSPASSPRERVHAVCRYWLTFYSNNENRMRLLAARAMQPSSEGTPRYRRSARRLPMFAEALATAARERRGIKTLALALAASTSFEAYITMKDTLQLSDKQLADLTLTIADALLDKFEIP